MTTTLVEKIADAVLYEGYILYPYRPSAVKNQQRWNFGALCPQSYSEANAGTEASTMQTECLIQANSNTTLDIKVRFLHLVTREVGRIVDCRLPIADCGHWTAPSPSPDSHFCAVPSLEVNGRLIQTWQEAIEGDVQLSCLKPADPDVRSHLNSFAFPQSETVEPLLDDVTGEILGVVIRRQQAIEGAIEVRIADFEMRTDQFAAVSSNSKSEIRNSKFDRMLKLTVRILNLTPFDDAGKRTRDEALIRSFVSTHTILNLRDGEFVSLLDPPEELRGAATGCSNIGTYPVLVGEEGARDCMLSSPIILYDYPQIAPESAGNLFDGTEIDEILTLRIMTLTDEEKREMSGADDRARRILERTEAMPAEQLMKMHGAMRSVKPKD